MQHAFAPRLLAERQILARLEHPHIARLIDGGVSDEGEPWLAMEYVDGSPLLEWCDRHRLGARSRIELFLQVCDAVHAAHRSLVVHRDLKPSNVLVEERAGGDANVKLLDFGIAKVLEDDAAAELTREGARPMTPSYAAPEQLRGDPITTATDVHALGVLLYELLCADQPRVRADLLHVMGDVYKRLGLYDRALALLKEAAELRSRTSGARSAERADSLSRAAEVLLYLGRRDEAEPLFQQALAIQQEVHGATSPEVADTLDLLGRLEQEKADFETARGYHERALDLRRRSFSEGSREVSESLQSLAMLATREGELAEAEKLFVEALEIRERELGVGHAETLELLHGLGFVQRQQGRFEESAATLRKTLELTRRVYGEGHQNVAATLNGLGFVQRALGDLRGAEESWREALAGIRDSEESPSRWRPVVSANLGTILQRSGRRDEAAPLLERALELDRRLYGERAPTVAEDLYRLGELHRAAGEHGRALERFDAALAIQQERFAASPQLARTLCAKGESLLALGRPGEAEKAFRSSIEAFHAQTPDDHPDVADARAGLAQVMLTRGELAEARRLLEKAEAALRDALGEEHGRTRRVERLLRQASSS